MVIAVATAAVGMTAVPTFDDHGRGVAVTPPMCLSMPIIVIAATDRSSMAMAAAILLMMSANQHAAGADFDLCHRCG